MQITIINRQKKIPVSKRAAKAAIFNALEILKVNQPGELTVVYVDNQTIQELNYRFLGEPYPTDVLCFNLGKKGRFVADIVISVEQAMENAARFRTSLSREMKLYLIHGLLHLFGYDDRRRRDRMRMHRKTLEILRRT